MKPRVPKSPKKNITDEIQSLPIEESTPTQLMLANFKALSRKEQDDVMRMIIDDAGIQRLLAVLNGSEIPGVGDMISDNVRYYHFFALAEDIEPGY